MSKRTIQQSMRIPVDLHDAGIRELYKKQKTDIKVSLTDILMGWARIGAIVEGQKIARVAPAILNRGPRLTSNVDNPDAREETSDIEP